MSKQYTSKGGRQLWKPSIEQINEMDDNCEGFCLACGNIQHGCEPDAAKYECEACGEAMVYGASELAQRGLCY